MKLPAVIFVLLAASSGNALSPARLTSSDPDTRQLLSSLEWKNAAGPQRGATVLVAAGPDSGIYFEQRFSAGPNANAVSCTVEVCGPVADAFLKTHPLVIQMTADGFGGAEGTVEGATELAAVTGKKVYRLDADKDFGEFRRDNALWVGVRDRFRTYMVRPQESDTVSVYKDSAGAGGYRVEIRCSPRTTSHSFVVYAGPVEYGSLRACDPQLTRLMFAMLWNWMRWLSFGLLFLLDWLIRIIPDTGIAVMALSICVKVLMSPLTMIARRWQKQVNLTKSRMQPVLDEIGRKYKGEERHRRTLNAYKDIGVSPLYAFKSLFGALIQIPVFFAAYHMLSENIALKDMRFLWIHDLSMPDRLFSFPFTIPFFGSHFNFLPFCMTGISLVASWMFSDRSLSPALRRKQRRNLYIMAAAFFVLFYTFPAGMVLYWTMNNVLSLADALYGRLRAKQAQL
jgi:YidC/Oxa1 family membrane protein insertase